MYESKFLQTRFHFSVGTAGVILSVGLAASAIFNPIAGLWMDKAGRLPLFMMGSLVFMNAGVAGNTLIPSCDRCFLPIIPLIAMSFASSMVGIANSSGIMRIIDRKSLATSFALSSVVYSIVHSLIPRLDGLIAEATYDEYGYQWVFTVNVGLGIIAFVLAAILNIADWRGAQKLQHVMSSSRRASTDIAPVLEESNDVSAPENALGTSEDPSVIVTIQRPLLNKSN